MKYNPYFDYVDGVEIMIMDDPSDDSREVYYRIAGSPFVFAFGLGKTSDMTMDKTIWIAKANVDNYMGVLF